MERLRFFLILIGILSFSCSTAQVFSLGLKQDKASMFQATVNVPLIFGKAESYDLAVGLDFTTKNNHRPSGLSPQITFVKYIVDSKYKDFLISANMQTGYVIDFNRGIGNQFRLSPHVYVEYQGVFNCRVGYDYSMPLTKGYPFVSIGTGGLMMFRHFSIM